MKFFWYNHNHANCMTLWRKRKECRRKWTTRRVVQLGHSRRQKKAWEHRVGNNGFGI